MSSYDPSPNANTRTGEIKDASWTKKSNPRLPHSRLKAQNSYKSSKIQKTGVATLFLLLLSSHLAPCLVGETPTQAENIFGKVFKSYTEEGTTFYTYVRENTVIQAEAQKGIIVCEVYAKTPQLGIVYGKSSQEEKEPISKTEITAILELYGGIALHWTINTEEEKTLFFHKDKTIMALWDQKHGYLLVATKARYEEWKKKQTAP